MMPCIRVPPAVMRGTKTRSLCATLFVLIVALPGTASAAEGRPAAQSMFDDADANGDGVVSRDEFVLARASRFARIDRNGDGYFDDSDLPERLLKRRKAGAGRVRARFDADGDGKVSKDEFVNGPTPLFDKADANGDGMLNEQELADAKAAARDWQPDSAGPGGETWRACTRGTTPAPAAALPCLTTVV